MKNKMIEDYLRENKENGIIDFAFRVETIDKGMIKIVLHPQYVNGETQDFEVHEDQLFNITNRQLRH